MGKIERLKKFKTPATGQVTDKPEVLATQSYVDNQIESLKTKLLNLIQSTVDCSNSETKNPNSNTIYILDGGTLTLGGPTKPSGVNDEWSPKGIRVLIYAKTASSLVVSNSSFSLSPGQYYEFIYIDNKLGSDSAYSAENWKEVNSWYARWY